MKCVKHSHHLLISGEKAVGGLKRLCFKWLRYINMHIFRCAPSPQPSLVNKDLLTDTMPRETAVAQSGVWCHSQCQQDINKIDRNTLQQRWFLLSYSHILPMRHRWKQNKQNAQQWKMRDGWKHKAYTSWSWMNWISRQQSKWNKRPEWCDWNGVL